MSSELSFPRQNARTQRFTLGAPRSFTIAPDGSRVVFLRSSAGDDKTHRLWVLDLDDAGVRSERVVADPMVLLAGAAEDLAPEERARRERSRESSGGVVAYATDDAVELASFTLSGRLFAVELPTGATTELHVPAPVIDPRPAPDGRLVAYVSGGALHVVGSDDTTDVALAEPDHPDVTWGLAEFVAAEEMDRDRGFWWSPSSDRLLAARVDNSPVERWWIADPANPQSAPTEVRYPVAGTANAEVTLALLGLDGARTDVGWDRDGFPYLADVRWSRGHPPLLHVVSRDQRMAQVLSVDISTGQTSQRHLEHDPDWLDLFSGVPAVTPDGRLVHIADRDGVRALTVDDRALTGPALHVRSVVDVDDDSVLIRASAGEQALGHEIGEIHVYRVDEQGVHRTSTVPGVHSAVRSGAVTVMSSASLDRSGTRVRVLRGDADAVEIDSYAQPPVIEARPTLTSVGEDSIPCAVLLPSGYAPGGGLLPVLMDPYGGPHGQRVVAAHNAYLTSQWFADQGFAVVVADGRGTPGRSPAWEKAIRNDFAGPILDDQITALTELATEYPLDLDRVAIRGWSFGGYLAALAVLRRPDVFHAAVAGAPVTDQRLYDTCYEERYLGHPVEQPEVYAANSLITDEGLSVAAETERPLLIIHGLADDNVVVAHSLRLSSALLASGHRHEVLPLSGITHLAAQEQVAENLLLHEIAFLNRSLGLTG